MSAVAYPPPHTDDPEGIRLLWDALDAAGFTADATAAALGLDTLFARDPSDLPAYLHLLNRDTPLAVLVELFLLGAAVDRRRAAGALGPLTLERAERMGVLTSNGDGLEAVLELTPVDGLVVASDQPKLHAHAPDHVLGIAKPTRVLGSLTVREPVHSALDIGTGSGYQALEAARHAGRVVAADINPRALRFAEFNAVLNGADNIEFREGSLFEPVEGETFSLAVCNPPYIISPENEFAFRDSGLPGDSFCEALVRDMPRFLDEGGFGQALLCWIHGDDEDWSTPLRGWVESSGCDALLLRYRTFEPLDYAAGWNRPLRGDPDAYAAAIDRWMAYYEKLAVERISWGGIVLRKRSGDANWVWTHEPSADRINPASDHLLRLFAAQDLLRSVSRPQELLDLRLGLADEHRLEQTVRLVGGDGAGPTVLRLDAGLLFRVELDGGTVNLLAALDGRRSLGEAIAAVAPGAGDAFRDSAVVGVTRLLELGFLEVAGDLR